MVTTFIAGSCSSSGPDVLEVVQSASSIPLNGVLEIEFGAPLDPLSVTSSSVLLRGDDGRPLSARMRVDGQHLRIELLVDAALLAAPPGELLVQLAGLPSLHALRAVSGSGLAAPRTVSVTVRPDLVAGLGPVRLESINGRPPREGETGDPVSHAGRVHLLFEGVLDPQTVTASSCRLYPVAEGLSLDPVHPTTRWSLFGTRFEVVLEDVPYPSEALTLKPRLGLRGLDGRPPVAPLSVTLASS